jgi:uncharacterized protein
MAKYWHLMGVMALSACSQPAPEKLKVEPALALTGRVVDGAEIIDANAEKKLTDQLAVAEQSYGPQLVIVTTKSLKGQDINDYGRELGNAWGIGDKRRNDGLLLIIAPNEQMTRIEVAKGLEASFTDDFAKSVIDQNLLPHFKAGRFQQGIEDGVERLIDKMQTAPTKATNDNALPKTEKDAA